MSTETQLQEKLQKIEALFAGAGTVGERLAAEAALERVQTRLADIGRGDRPIEAKLTVADAWLVHLFSALWRLFIALCRRVQLAGFIGGFAAMFGWGMLTAGSSWMGNAVAFGVGAVGVRLYIQRNMRAAPRHRTGRDGGGAPPDGVGR
jgi:hypothetical protein